MAGISGKGTKITIQTKLGKDFLRKKETARNPGRNPPEAPGITIGRAANQPQSFGAEK